MEVSEALKRFRKDFKLRQKDVAEILNINIKTYQFYEYGKANIPVNSILKLADKFNLSTDYLLGRDTKLFQDKLINALKTCFEVSKPIIEELNEKGNKQK